MMRISEISRSESVRRFRLEGRLTQATVADLLATVESPLAAGTTVLLDLASVSFADPTAVETLLALRARGVVLAAASGFVLEMLRSDAGVPRRSAAAALGSGEADLLARLRGGDEAAFAELVERYGGRLLAAVRRLLRNEEDARDAVQDAFLSAFKALASFNGDAKLSTWLHRIAINAALMRLRSGRNRRERSIDDLLPRFDEDGGWAQATEQVAHSSEELIERRDTRAMVRRCIDQLPDTYRTILMLRDIEDLDTDEAAALLGITPNAAKIRLHRARQALRTLIETGMPSPHAEAASAACEAQP
jgi:RNA polymerase sigma-70 factor (ECF subfamily)